MRFGTRGVSTYTGRRIGVAARSRLLAATLAATLLAFAGPASAQETPPPAGAASDTAGAPIVVVDDAGRRVVFERPPCRIVSLIPAATEILYALGAGECLAGRSTWDDYPPEVLSVPDAGLAIGADAERVVALRPDLVLLVAGSDNARTVDEFERLGVRSLVFRMNRLPDLRRVIERLGRVLRREAAADSVWDAIERDLAEVRARTAGLDRPVVYYDIAYPPPITVGRGSYLDTLISIAGGRNAFHDVAAPSPTVSLEAIVVRDPDLIVFPVGEDWTGAAEPSSRPLWSRLRAVREGRVRRVDAGLLHRLGPRVGRAVRALARAIHPEAFPDPS